MFIDILKGKKYKIFSEKESLKYIPQKEKVTKNELNDYVKEIFHQKNYSQNEVNEAMKYIEDHENYQPGELGVKPGRGYEHHHPNKPGNY